MPLLSLIAVNSFWGDRGTDRNTCLSGAGKFVRELTTLAVTMCPNCSLGNLNISYYYFESWFLRRKEKFAVVPSTNTLCNVSLDDQTDLKVWVETVHKTEV